jgi:thiamine biosynthesis lipoprotein
MVNLSVITKFFFISLLLTACTNSLKESKEKKQFELVGETQGTTFTIKIVDESCNVNASEVKNLLAQFDLALSSYISGSIISKVNEQAVGTVRYYDSLEFFSRCFNKSTLVFDRTRGAFEPSIFPLVKAWGFFKDEHKVLQQNEVNKLLKIVDFNSGVFYEFKCVKDSFYYTKKHKDFKLDFNAIAQGYAVDVLCDLLESKNHHSYYVEIGGELRVSGRNSQNELWQIGIDKPIDAKENQTNRPLQTIVSLSNGAIATSGNYRKFYIKDGKKYAHILSPTTGFPVNHSLLSATVFTKEAAFSDGFATAFMVFGLEKTKEFLKNNEYLKLEVYLIYTDDSGLIKTWISDGFKKHIRK